jgi:predicted nucleic acid binding AN1-type Zn finger protein
MRQREGRVATETTVQCPRHHRTLQWARCECCGGEGHIEHYSCENCNGEGGWHYCDVCIEQDETAPEPEE